MSSYADSKSARITIATIHSLLVIVNLTGNTLVCAVIIKNSDMRKSFNYLLVNLAIADMTLAVFFVPRYIIMGTLNFNHPDGVTGTILCELITGGNLAWVGSGASVFTLVAIAIERYNAVINLYRNKCKLTKLKLKGLIPCSWIFGVIMMIPEFLVKRFNKETNWCTASWPEQWMPKVYSITWFLLLAFFPVLIMTALYYRVVFTLWYQRKESDTINNRQQEGNVCKIDPLQLRSYKRTSIGGRAFMANGYSFSLTSVMKMRKRVTLMAVIVSGIFAVCWLTYSISYIIRFYTSAHSFIDVTYIASKIMIMLNAAINPVVYALVNKRFREKMKRMMRCDGHPTAKIIHPDGKNSGTEGFSRVLQRTQETRIL